MRRPHAAHRTSRWRGVPSFGQKRVESSRLFPHVGHVVSARATGPATLPTNAGNAAARAISTVSVKRFISKGF
jgi:hypothetical protein